VFDQFKENVGLAKDFTATVRDGLRSAQATWRRATVEKRTIWLLVPAVVVVSTIADHFSAPWYYQLAALVLVGVLVVLGSGMRRAMLRKR
jgi:hypothetical protein